MAKLRLDVESSGAPRVEAELAKVGNSIKELARDFERTGNVEIFKKLNAERGVQTNLKAIQRDLSETGAEADRTERRFANLASSGASKLGMLGHTVASMLGNLGANAISTMVSTVESGLTSLAKLSVGAAAANETARVSFDLLLGSAEKSARFLSDLQKFAAATPFDLPTLKDAASRLLAVGVNTKDIIPLMTRLGDAAAGMGTGAEGIQRAVYALQQMRQSGRVTLEDVNQLTDAGIPALDALAAHFKTTVAKIRDQISAGKIKADDLFGAIEQGEGPAFTRLKGMMDKQSATLSGVWSTFKDNASQALAGFVEPALPKLKKLTETAAEDIPKIIDKLKEFGKSEFGQKLFAALDKAGKEIIPFARKAFDDLGKTIAEHKDGLIKFGNLMINDVIPALAKLTEIIIGGTVGAFKGLIIVVAFVGEHFQQMRAIVVGQTRVMVDIFLGYLKLIIDGAAQAFGWIPGLGPKLRSAAAGFDRFFDDVNSKLDNLARDRHFTITAFFKTAGSAAAAQNFASGGQARFGAVFAEGGWVPGPPGKPLPAIVHGGEYVLSRDMLAGRAATALGARAGAPGRSPIYNLTVNAGAGADGQDVGSQIIAVIRQYEQRNGTTWRT